VSMICELFVIPAQTARQLAADPGGVHAVLRSLEGSDSVLSLEKSWHGLHFTLTGTAWAGNPPLNLLAAGGTPVGDEDVGYGPARVISPSEVVALNAALAAFTEADFDRDFDPAKLGAAEVYPQIWDEPLEDLKQEYGGYLREMKAHVREAAEAGRALMVTIR
jgi:hypothetical protein